MNCFTLRLILTQRQMVPWKWPNSYVLPIPCLYYFFFNSKLRYMYVSSSVPLFHVHTSLKGSSSVLCFTKLFSDRNLRFLQCLLLVRKHLLHVFLLFLHSCLCVTFTSNKTLNKSYTNLGLINEKFKCLFACMWVGRLRKS